MRAQIIFLLIIIVVVILTILFEGKRFTISF